MASTFVNNCCGLGDTVLSHGLGDTVLSHNKSAINSPSLLHNDSYCPDEDDGYSYSYSVQGEAPVVALVIRGHTQTSEEAAVGA